MANWHEPREAICHAAFPCYFSQQNIGIKNATCYRYPSKNRNCQWNVDDFSYNILMGYTAGKRGRSLWSLCKMSGGMKLHSTGPYIGLAYIVKIYLF